MDPGDFTKYSDDIECNTEAIQEFFQKFSGFTGLNLYGIDIIVDKRDGRHLVIDCNYFPSYSNVEPDHLLKALNDMFSLRLGPQIKIKELSFEKVLSDQ